MPIGEGDKWATEHNARVFYGDWHAIPYCSCGWQTAGTNLYYASENYPKARAHERRMNSRMWRARRWLRALILGRQNP